MCFIDETSSANSEWRKQENPLFSSTKIGIHYPGRFQENDTKNLSNYEFYSDDVWQVLLDWYFLLIEHTLILHCLSGNKYWDT